VSCGLRTQVPLPLIVDVTELGLVVFIVGEDTPTLVAGFHQQLERWAGEIPSNVLNRIRTMPFQIVIGFRGLYELLNGVSNASTTLRYFPASASQVEPPPFRLTELATLADLYNKAGRRDEAASMFERLAEFPVSDSGYHKTSAAAALAAGNLDRAREATERVRQLERYEKHAWQVIIPQFSGVQPVSPELEPPVLLKAEQQRFRNEQDEYQLNDEQLAAVAGAFDREAARGIRILGLPSIRLDGHRTKFLRWMVDQPNDRKNSLIQAYNRHGGELMLNVPAPRAAADGVPVTFSPNTLDLVYGRYITMAAAMTAFMSITIEHAAPLAHYVAVYFGVRLERELQPNRTEADLSSGEFLSDLIPNLTEELATNARKIIAEQVEMWYEDTITQAKAQSMDLSELSAAFRASPAVINALEAKRAENARN
jgi:tetratricopeptide (TPR) repeat protein